MSPDQFLQLAELFPMAGLAEADLTGRYVQVSRRYCEIVGRTAEELYQLRMQDITHPGDLPRTRAAFENLARNGPPYIIEKRYLRPDGSVVWVQINVTTPKHAADQPQTALAAAIDITERKRAEAALRESEVRLETELADTRLLQTLSTQLIPERNADALYERITDAALALLRADFASLQMLDPARGVLRLLAHRGFTPGAATFWEWVRIDSDSTCGAALRTRGRVIAADVESCDFMAGTADLATYRQTGVRAVQTTPLIARDGRVVGMLSTHWRAPHQPSESDLRLLDILARQAADLIERKRVEMELHAINGRMSSLLENIDEGFLVLDSEWRFVYLNATAERLNRLRREEILGKNHWEVFPETVGTRVHRELLRVAAEKVKAEFENYYEPWDKWYAIKAYPTAEGGVNFHFRDITEAKGAETRLHASEEGLRLVLDSMPQKVFTATPAGDVDYFNPQWMEFTGLPFETIRDWGWTQFVHPDDVAGNVRAWRHAVATGETFRFEHRFRRADGQYRWHLSQADAVRDADGRIIRWVGANTDIDDVRRAEIELRDSEQRFRQFAEHTRKLFWMTDPVTGRVLYVNHGYRDIWGRTGESLYAAPQSFLEGIHPDDRPRVIEAIQRQLTGEGTFLEYRVIRPDGSMRWVVDRAFPIRDETGRVYRVAGIAEDITARKRVEEDMRFLAGASAALASLMDDASTLQKVARLAVPFFADWCAVDMLDADGNVRRVAVAHVDPTKVELAHELHRRYPPDPAAPQGVWNILRTGRPEMVSDITDEMITASVPDAERLRTIRELGLRSYIGVPLVTHGRVLGVITFITAESGRLYDANDLAVAEDLAHRAAVAVENAKLYDSLKESDRRKDEFLAVLAHELRNPLAPIRNALHIMKLPTATPSAVGRVRDVAERQVTHLTRLVDDLLDVSRIVRGKIELRKERVELATVVNRAIETARPVIDAEKHELSAVIDAAPIWLNADPVRLAQVVANLLNNAAKYTEKGGRIRLTASREDDVAVIRVRDSGIGLDRNMLSRIFEMFIQVAPAHARSQGGLGIGLTLVRSLIELHGGTIAAHSDGPGRGSEFIVRLPMDARAERGRGEAVMNHDGSAPAPNARRVLVVDDNTDAAESLAVLLRLSGHESQVANDGIAALKVAREMRPDLILLDIGMPGMDGYEVARRLRQDAAFRSVKLIALTGWGQEEDRRRSKAAGFDAHYVKPIDPDVLEQLLEREPPPA